MKSLNKAGFTLFLIVALNAKLSAQTTTENFIGTKEAVIEAWFFKGITEDYKLNVFSLNEVVHTYDSNQNTFLSYTVFGYDAWNGLGPLVGTRLTEGRSSGLLGIQYGKGGENFFITTNFASELRENPFFEWYILTQYRFPINEKLKFFGQFQNSTNFNNESHSFSLQRLRVGLSWQKIQFGLGVNTYQHGEEWQFESTPGAFFRLEF